MASDMRDTASSASAGSLDARRNSPGARIVWIESARGLGILLVVVGHVLHGLTAHGLMAAGPLHRVWDSEYYNARMPLFFVLSGLFAERWAARDGGAFLLDKAATLVYPYFLWSTLQGVVRIAMATAVKGESPFEYLIWMPVYPVMQFWFIYVLFFISLWHFAMRKSGLGAVGCVVVAMLLYGVRPWGGENMQSSPMPLLRILYYAPFYAVGALAGLHLDRLRVEGALRQGAVAIGGLAVVVASARWLVDPPVAVQMLATLCGVAGLIALSALLSRTPGMGFFRVLGRRSLEIYVVHMFTVESVRPALASLLHVRDPAIHIVVGVATSLAAPLALVWLCDRCGFKYAFRLPRPSASGPRPAARREPGVAMA
jgi:fucose 4-O-acetylase-like acetyltransferase